MNNKDKIHLQIIETTNEINKKEEIGKEEVKEIYQMKNNFSEQMLII